MVWFPVYRAHTTPSLFSTSRENTFRNSKHVEIVIRALLKPRSSLPDSAKLRPKHREGLALWEGINPPARTLTRVDLDLVHDLKPIEINKKKRYDRQTERERDIEMQETT